MNKIYCFEDIGDKGESLVEVYSKLCDGVLRLKLGVPERESGIFRVSRDIAWIWLNFPSALWNF